MEDADLEAIILEAKKLNNAIYSSQLNENSNDIIMDILAAGAKNKLLAYGLIENDNITKGAYLLTAKGIQFKSFKDEDDRNELIDGKLKVDFEIAKNLLKSYPYTRFIAWASFIIAVLLGWLKLAELIKLWPYHK